MLLNEHARVVFRTKTTYARCCVDVWIIEKKREKASERARTREREKNKDIKEIHLMLFSPLVYHPLVVLSRLTSYTIHESELLGDFVREKRGKKRERERERKNAWKYIPKRYDRMRGRRMHNARRLCLFYFVCTFVIKMLHLLRKLFEPYTVTFTKKIVQIFNRREEFAWTRDPRPSIRLLCDIHKILYTRYGKKKRRKKGRPTIPIQIPVTMIRATLGNPRLVPFCAASDGKRIRIPSTSNRIK